MTDKAAPKIAEHIEGFLERSHELEFHKELDPGGDSHRYKKMQR